ncbi:MAG: cytosine deaminase, partial [Mesorhizobium sp.]
MIPNTGSYRLANARLHQSLTPGLAAGYDNDGFALADIAVANGEISAISGHDAATTADAIDLGGRIVLPCFVDCHTHIDKGH